MDSIVNKILGIAVIGISAVAGFAVTTAVTDALDTMSYNGDDSDTLKGIKKFGSGVVGGFTAVTLVGPVMQKGFEMLEDVKTE